MKLLTTNLRPMMAAFALLFAVGASAQAVLPVPPLMNFQGRLARPDGTPVPDGTYNITFSIYNAPTGATLLLWQKSLPGIVIHNGAFAARLDYSNGFQNGATLASAFSGSLVYLDISINGGASLMPRQQFVSNAYAFTAQTAFSVANGSVTGASIAPGAITADKFAANLLNPIAWLLGGNSGANGPQFLGTTDKQPLIFKVNGRQAMRYSYAENSADPNPANQYRSINALGGSELNSIAAGVVGATLAGGGYDAFTGTDYPNTVTADFGAVGGGAGNTVFGNYAAIAGGLSNTASGDHATIGGGYLNSAVYINATVAGGVGNTASHFNTTVGGGQNNTASGYCATVGGGQHNTALGFYSSAGGQQAQANHEGAFVWNDASNSNFGNFFASTAPNQFLIHATGGVGVNTNAPGGFALRVAGNVDFDGLLIVNGTFYASDARYKTSITPLGNALDSVLNLRGVSYEWDRAKWPEKNFGEGKQFGFVAQELEQVFPELVCADAKGHKSVNYVGIVPVLVEAVKTQQKQMDELKRDNAAARKENAELKARLAAIEADVAELKAQINPKK